MGGIFWYSDSSISLPESPKVNDVEFTHGQSEEQGPQPFGLRLYTLRKVMVCLKEYRLQCSVYKAQSVHVVLV